MNHILKIFTPSTVYAQGEVWSDKCVSNGDVATIQGLECLFGNALNAVVGLAGIVFFVMLLVGGFKYLTSGGDPKKVAASYSTLSHSVFGLIGTIVAWLILLLIKNFTGVDVTIFKIPS